MLQVSRRASFSKKNTARSIKGDLPDLESRRQLLPPVDTFPLQFLLSILPEIQRMEPGAPLAPDMLGPAPEVSLASPELSATVSETATLVLGNDSFSTSAEPESAITDMHAEKVRRALLRRRLKQSAIVIGVAVATMIIAGLLAMYSALPILVKRGLEESEIVPTFFIHNITEGRIKVHMTSHFYQETPIGVRIDPFVLAYGTKDDIFGHMGMAGFELGNGVVDTDIEDEFVVANGTAFGEFGHRVLWCLSTNTTCDFTVYASGKITFHSLGFAWNIIYLKRVDFQLPPPMPANKTLNATTAAPPINVTDWWLTAAPGVAVNLTIDNTAGVAASLGDVAVDVAYNNRTVSTVTLDDFTLNMGVTAIPVEFEIASFSDLVVLGFKSLNRNKQLNVSVSNIQITPPGMTEGPTWMRRWFEGITFTIPLNQVDAQA